jgi:hypothetical protein
VRAARSISASPTVPVSTDQLSGADRRARLTVLARKLAIGDQRIDHCALGEPRSLYGGKSSAPLNLPSCFEDFVDPF